MEKKKKIAIIGAKGLPARDGISRVVEGYTKYLTDKYEFTIFCTEAYTRRKNGHYDGYEEVVLSKIKNLRLNTLWYFIKATWIILFYRKFDLIHFHHSDAAFLFPLIRLKYGKKIVVTTHGTYCIMNDKWEKFKLYFIIQSRFFLRFAPVLTAVSKNEKKNTKEIINRESTFIPNGINLNEKVSEKDVGSDYLFYAAGRIMEVKGIDVMLEALHKIGYAGKIKIAGDISMAPLKFQEKVKELSKGLDIENLGMLTDKSLLYKYLKNAKFFIYPTKMEAMSTQLLEAASMQVPLIISNLVENTDLFSDDEALFFKSGDSNDLAKKIEYAFANEKQMKQCAEKAYKSLEENYTWDVIAQKYSQVYEEILTRK